MALKIINYFDNTMLFWSILFVSKFKRTIHFIKTKRDRVFVLAPKYIFSLTRTFLLFQIFVPLSLIFNRTKVLVSISLLKIFKKESKKIVTNKKAADQLTF